MNEKSSNEKRLAALGSRGRGPPRSGGRPGLFDCWIFIGILLMETAGAARDACGAGGPARHGGKCTRIAGNRGTFPGGEAVVLAG